MGRGHCDFLKEQGAFQKVEGMFREMYEYLELEINEKKSEVMFLGEEEFQVRYAVKETVKYLG